MLENSQLPGSTINHFVALHPRAFQFPETRGLFRPSCPNILLRQACCPLLKHTAGPGPEGRQPAHMLSMEKATCSCSTCLPRHKHWVQVYLFFSSFLATWQVRSQYPKQGSNPCPSLEAQSLNHWTPRGLPGLDIFVDRGNAHTQPSQAAETLAGPHQPKHTSDSLLLYKCQCKISLSIYSLLLYILFFTYKNCLT